MVKNNIHSRVRWVQLQCFLLFHMDIYKSERLTLGSVVFLISYLWICWFSCLWFSLFSACHVIFLALVLPFCYLACVPPFIFSYFYLSAPCLLVLLCQSLLVKSASPCLFCISCFTLTVFCPVFSVFWSCHLV